MELHSAAADRQTAGLQAGRHRAGSLAAPGVGASCHLLMTSPGGAGFNLSPLSGHRDQSHVLSPEAFVHTSSANAQSL